MAIYFDELSDVQVADQYRDVVAFN